MIPNDLKNSECATATNQKATIFLSCLVFAFFLLMLPGTISSMFGDPDTGWHLAAGDLIRQSGALPLYDPWSFTAGTHRWFNAAWGWDVIASYLYQHSGWQGIVAINSITIAATMALVFAAALIHTQHGIAAFLATLLAMIFMFSVSARPFQVTYLLTAATALLLSQVAHGRWHPRWLLVLPVMMVVWVNMHGGFLVGLFLLGMYGLAALLQKNMKLLRWLAGWRHFPFVHRLPDDAVRHRHY